MEQNIILGPPGTGKTTTLLNIVAELLNQGYTPDEIAYCSFTRQGAYQGKEKAKEKFNLKDKDFPFFKTLHSIAFTNGGFNIDEMVDKRHYKILSDALGMHFTGHYTEEFYNNDDKYLSAIKLRHNNPKVAFEYTKDLDIKTMRFVNINYKAMKRELGLVDYVDIIEEFVKRNNALPVRVAIIDEAQDLTTLQWKMALIAFRDCEKIYIAGDDDQAIYEWSGADIDFFLSLKGNLRILNHSYRLPKSIMNYSKSISKSIKKRTVKDFSHSGKMGGVIPLNSLQELRLHNTDEKWLFLARNNSRLEMYDTFLRDKGIIYKRKGKNSLDKKIVKAINIYESFRKTKVITPEDEYFLEGYIKPEGKFSYNDAWYDSLELPFEDMVYYRNILQNKTDLNSTNFSVSTIHSIKGAEAENVVLFLDISRSAYKNYMVNNDAELRVYYVACTRASKNLFLIYPDSKFSYPIY